MSTRRIRTTAVADVLELVPSYWLAIQDTIGLSVSSPHHEAMRINVPNMHQLHVQRTIDYRSTSDLDAVSLSPAVLSEHCAWRVTPSILQPWYG